MEALRVLWITPGFASSESDSNCIPPLQLLALDLKARGVDLHIMTLGYPFHNEPYPWHGIPVKPFYRKNHMFRWLNWLSVVRYAFRLNNNKKIKAIHSFWFGPAWLIGTYLRFKWGIRHITTLMGTDVLKSNFYLHFLREKNIKSLVAVSQFQANHFELTTRWTVGHIIGWGLDNKAFPYSVNDIRPIDILGCGSLISLKNWPLWIDVMQKLVAFKPHLKAEIIGDGPERKKLEIMVVKSGLSPNVHFMGEIPRSMVMHKMEQAKIFLHTSEFESFGLVFLEAVANGCSIISTAVGIAPSVGSCARTSDELVELIQKALEQLQVNKRYTIPTIIETSNSYMELYNERMD